MLISLSIKDYVLIEDASLELGPGLTVLSGETGAGKTLLTQALGLLLGERAAEGLVSERSEEALIQGVFELSDDYVLGVLRGHKGHARSAERRARRDPPSFPHR